MARHNRRRSLWCVTLNKVDTTYENPALGVHTLAAFPIAAPLVNVTSGLDQWAVLMHALADTVVENYPRVFRAPWYRAFIRRVEAPIGLSSVGSHLSAYAHEAGVPTHHKFAITQCRLYHGPAHLRLRSTKLIVPTASKIEEGRFSNISVEALRSMLTSANIGVSESAHFLEQVQQAARDAQVSQTAPVSYVSVDWGNSDISSIVNTSTGSTTSV